MDIELENEIQKRLHKYHKKMWASYGAIAIDILFLIYIWIYGPGHLEYLELS